MQTGEIVFLALILSCFAVFAVALASASVKSRRLR